MTFLIAGVGFVTVSLLRSMKFFISPPMGFAMVDHRILNI
jgi:hypothetical protein